MFKFGVASLIWTEEFTIKDLPLIEKARSLSFEVMDINVSYPERFPAEAVSKKVKEVGIEPVTSIGLPADRCLIDTDPAVRRKGVETFETKHRTKSGEIRDILVNARAISIKGEKFVQGIWHDITERKRAEETLRESEKKCRSLMNNASDAIMLSDFEGNILEINKKAEKLLGHSKEELLEMNITQIHPREEIERITAGFKQERL